MRYIKGNVYNDRIYLSRNKAVYTMKCIHCGVETNQSINGCMSTVCKCKLDNIKYKIGDIINNRMIVGRARPAGLVVKCKDCRRVALLQYINIDKTLCICKRDNYARRKAFYLGQSIKQWSELLGVSKNTIHTRMYRGDTLDKALGFNSGIIQYDTTGKPICEICGLSFNKLGNHTRMTHGILSSEYKKLFGLDNKQSLMSQKSIELARKRNLENYDLVVTDNLINKGIDTRFKDGGEGRPIDKCRKQTLIRLSNKLKGKWEKQ